LQSKFASALHCPEQLASHCALQSAFGGVTSQLALHSPSQLALHAPSHSARAPLPLASAAHRPLQSALQLAEQLAWQSKLPGSTWQSASQRPEQSTSHSAVALALHRPSHLPAHAAVRLTGSQLASHPPEVRISHWELAASWKFPQASGPGAADAEVATSKGAAKVKALTKS
jgi:hypothetical protein